MHIPAPHEWQMATAVLDEPISAQSRHQRPKFGLDSAPPLTSRGVRHQQVIAVESQRVVYEPVS